MSGEFCDTNVIVYAYERNAGDKREQAGRLLERLWASGDGVISIQVLQELFVSLRKAPRSTPVEQARSVIAGLATWRVMTPTPDEVLQAIDASDQWRVSFWDAMILTMANKASASVVWSEDLKSGQRYGGVVVQNPFSSSL